MSELSLESVLAPERFGSMVQLLLVGGVLSLAPAILLMTTCFVRFTVVLTIVRQGFQGVQFPPNQVLTALSLFLTAGVMWPVWTSAYEQGIAPYAQQEFDDPREQQRALAQAWTRTLRPVRQFMSAQIETAGNSAAVDLLVAHHTGAGPAEAPQFYEDLPLSILLPAYVLSELMVAFAIGFQLLLPFVVIDLVTASVIQSLGLTALPTAGVAFPLKLLAFVLIDGWFLVVETLLAGVQAVQ